MLSSDKTGTSMERQMHLVTTLALLALLLMGLMFFFGIRGHNRAAWTCALLFSVDSIALVFAIAQDPSPLIVSWVKEATNFVLLYVLIGGMVMFWACLILGIRWLFVGKPAPEEAVYSTHRYSGPRADGSWTASLQRNGKTFTQVEVGSISNLIAHSRK